MKRLLDQSSQQTGKIWTIWKDYWTSL